MSVLAGRRGVVAAAVLLVVAGCTGQPASSPTPTTTTTSPGAMTGEELVWLQGIRTLHTTMDAVLTNAPQPITTDSMRGLAQQLAGCTAALDGLGAPTSRLRPVHDLALQGCDEYERAADCFTTAADLGVVVAGSPEEQQQEEAVDCAFAAPGEGSRLFADAEVEGFNISTAATGG